MTEFIRTQFTFRNLVTIILIAVFSSLILFYILFQARFLITGPTVTLIDEPASIQNNQVINLRGQAENITHISLNGRQIFTDRAGYFDEALVLENGYTVATIQVTDRYGRQERIVKKFVYTPTSIIPL